MLFKSSPLNKIKAPIATELADFEIHFKNSMKSSVPLLDKITYYIVQRKGKQVRPIFVFLCAKIWGDINDKTHIAASFIEILHTATLVHDDVVDDSYERRGFFSINALWKNKIAVIVGDYLLSKGLLLAIDNEEFLLLKIMAKAVKDMSEGELMQLEKARKLDIEEDIYYEIIRQKTASLIASACAAGTASVTDDKGIIEKSRLFGETIGIAFQIKDDLFDYGSKAIGKPRGIDIKEKKMTLPLIYALSKADKKERKSIIKSIKRKSTDPEVVKKVIDFVKEKGGLEYAKEAMNAYKDKAMDILSTFPPSESRDGLLELVNYVIEREK
ncbi:MAG: polyprenyl synthetase family protein [Saprospiraceae bacterium]|nr:polyprenyl synthetase family protein [Bacteroidia bacterium]NNE16535.1 polyprenyl synthetase family protein [Saprospiraceae bacterium]NNL91796.1 polyprenyl synthetase family protein [Saprospiraceae bacterium]